MPPLKATFLRLLLFLIALGIAATSMLFPAAEGRIPAMKLNVFAADTVPGKPLIDTDVPKQLATATFALG